VDTVLPEWALEHPEPWLTGHLGAPPGPDTSPVLREDYAWRASMWRHPRGCSRRLNPPVD
jgi:hypothetical protein